MLLRTFGSCVVLLLLLLLTAWSLLGVSQRHCILYTVWLLPISPLCVIAASRYLVQCQCVSTMRHAAGISLTARPLLCLSAVQFSSPKCCSLYTHTTCLHSLRAELHHSAHSNCWDQSNGIASTKLDSFCRIRTLLCPDDKYYKYYPCSRFQVSKSESI